MRATLNRTKISVVLLGVSLFLVFGAHVLMHTKIPEARHSMALVWLLQLTLFCWWLEWRGQLRWLSMVLLVWNISHISANSYTDFPIYAEIPSVVRYLSFEQKPVILGLSDNAKWQLWVAIVKQQHLPDDEQTRERGCSGWIGWLGWYEFYCGAKQAVIYSPTTHLLLAPQDLSLTNAWTGCRLVSTEQSGWSLWRTR